MSGPPPDKLRLGIIGLGRAFTLMLPTFVRHPLIELVAAYDPRPEARARFEEDFAGKAYDTADGVCTYALVQAVYIASPHGFHVDHVCAAARAGKHALVEKPMSLTLADCQRMIDVMREAGLHLLVGHSHSFDAPYLSARALLQDGAFGAVRMITALNFTDFLYRPRRPEELDTKTGGGVVFSQAAHQVDVVRLLAGTPAKTVRGVTGVWDRNRPTEGAYTALITFENGAAAALTYSGYARFDTDEFNGWIGELGQVRNPQQYGLARAALAAVNTSDEEAALKGRRAYGASGRDAFLTDIPQSHNHFGLVVVSCERGDVRPTPEGVILYGDTERRFAPLAPPEVPRAEVIDELYAAVINGKPALHSGEWGLATLEICLAILQSAAEQREIALNCQI